MSRYLPFGITALVLALLIHEIGIFWIMAAVMSAFVGLMALLYYASAAHSQWEG